MNNIKKVGLTALAGSLAMFSVAQADLVLSGSTEATYTSNGSTKSAGNPMGLSNDFSLTGTGELDNGMTYKAFTNFAGQDMGTDSNYLSLDMGSLGIVSLDQGNEIAGISTLTNFGNPSAYEEADHGVSTLDDKLDSNATGAIGYSNTVEGVSVSIEYIPTVTAIASQAGGTSGSTADATKSQLNYAIKGSIPGVEGLTLAYGSHSTDSSSEGVSDDTGKTYGAQYSIANVTVGYQVVEQQSGVASSAGFNGKMYGAAFNVNENFSVSYNIADMETDNVSTADVTEESTGISAAYTMGSASIRMTMNDADNVGGVAGVNAENTELSLALAF
jgi:outer membrane protein OmpU